MQRKNSNKISIGTQIGKLTVSADTKLRKNGYTVWQCDCSCGGTIMLDTRALLRGNICDCGCETKVRPGQKDLTGQRFGKLIALETTKERADNGSAVWKCRCDCGNECLAVATQLTKGYKKSCGCLSHPPLKSYIGQRFGQLTVIEYHGKKNGMHRWKCLCDCGKETVVGQTLLQSGKTKSCGCLQAKMITENRKLINGTSVTLLEKAGERLISNNTSGHNGVYFNRKSQKWIAQIGFKGKNYYLGTYKDIQEAVTARKNAEEKIYGSFLEWYYNEYGHAQGAENNGKK